MKVIDALIEGHIKRFIQKVETARETERGRISFVEATPTVEFLSELEWGLLKLLLGAKNDADIIAYFETHPYYMDVLVAQFGTFAHEIYPTGTTSGMFCTINLEYRR